MIAVSLDDVRVDYGRVHALDSVTLEVPAGTVLGIIGANGSGKSTLLKSIAGLLRPVRGTVRVFERSPRRNPAATIAYVPQVEHVDWSFPATVRDVVAMGRYPRLRFYRGFDRRDHELVDQAIERLGLAGFRDRRISALSGGQQQRVFLARALAQEPRLLLLDEPTTGVDAETEGALRTVVRALPLGETTVMMTTHDLAGIGEWFDRVIVVERRIVASGTPAEISALGLPAMHIHEHGHARSRHDDHD